MAKLTERRVEALKPGDKDSFTWDSELPGFGVRVTTAGVRSYVVQYRRGNRTRRLTLGRHRVLKAEQARALAQDTLAMVRRGDDPAAERQAERQASTVAALSEKYIEQHALPKKKASSIRRDRALLRRCIVPAIGPLSVNDVTRRDVTALHHSLRTTPYEANRALSLLSKMFALAVLWDVRRDGINPCRGVEKYKEHKRQRYLSGEELAQLGAVLRDVERERVEWPTVVPALRLALFTGARIGEILGLRWEWVDLERGVLELPDSKTGAKTIHINLPASEVLRGIEEQDGNPFVIYGRKTGARLRDIDSPWGRIRVRAKIPDVRVHDLRHTFASAGAGMGASLPVIGALLGHTEASTTQRYAHLSADPLKDAAQRIGSRIAASLRAKPKGRSNVVELRSPQANTR